jgi:hypothetical protein
MNHVDLDLPDEASRRLWHAIGDLAGRLPGEWVLIGGLMVQLHAFEHGMADVRPTRDIDLLAQARPPGALRAIDEFLRGEGFEATAPDLDGFAHRYERGDLILDLLAPDGLSSPPELGGGVRAVGVPGGSQALNRSEVVSVSIDGKDFELRRPTLMGAILIKARSLMGHADPEAQREDLLRLLALVDDPRAMGADLKKTERRWLRQAEDRLTFDAVTRLDGSTVRAARLGYRILTREP